MADVSSAPQPGAPGGAEILLIVGHPELEQSRANRRLLRAALALQRAAPAGRIEVPDLYALYPASSAVRNAGAGRPDHAARRYSRMNFDSSSKMNLASGAWPCGLPARCPQIDGMGRNFASATRAISWRTSSTGK